MHNTLTGETVELLQHLIRNQCVNDGTVGSGQEVRTTDVLRAYLEGSGLAIEVYEPPAAPGRTSLVARIEGSDPAAPTLCLMGHTDVVPVNPQAWTRDPFGGELVHGEVWGRGALDMLTVIGKDDWSEEQWREATIEAETRAAARAAREGRRWMTGLRVRVHKITAAQEEHVDKELIHKQAALTAELRAVSESVSGKLHRDH